VTLVPNTSVTRMGITHRETPSGCALEVGFVS